MMFRLWLFLGRRGWFTHDGMVTRGPRWYPRARVWYPDVEKYSAVMCIGNACHYAGMFGGEVHPLSESKPA